MNVAVIGAGIVGMSCASQLQQDGHAVTVIDPEPPGTQCSFGNAGSISSHSCVPMAYPGMVRQVPGWLGDPLGPLAIRWRYLPRALPWLVRFLASGTPARIEAQAKALRALHTPAVDAHLELARRIGATDLIQRNGTLFVYETEEAFAADARGRDLMRRNGVTVDEIGADDIRQLEPGLTPIFVRGAFVGEGGHCLDPGGLVGRIAADFQRNGGTLLRRRATGFDIGPDGVRAVRTDGGDVPCDAVVIAAGAWSHRLTAMLGSSVPLESERGYHTVLADSGVSLRRSVSFPDRRFMATSMAMGLRLAGTVEFAGLEAPPNYARADALVVHARRVFRDLDESRPSRWSGHRPSTPDSVPVISASPQVRNAVFAFGHGHLGLTAGPITGRHVAAMVAGRPTAIDMAPYRVDRF